MENDLNNIADLEIFFNQNKVFDILNIDSIGIFGSFARGESASDIDLLLENVVNKKKAIELKEELEKKTGKKIDLVFNEYANPIILHRAKKDLKYVKKYKE